MGVSLGEGAESDPKVNTLLLSCCFATDGGGGGGVGGVGNSKDGSSFWRMYVSASSMALL